MSLLKKLFGGGAESAPEGEEYQGFTILPLLNKEAQGYRLSARIEKEIDGDLKTYTLIRADVISAREDAMTATLAKARQVIDEQGDALFR